MPFVIVCPFGKGIKMDAIWNALKGLFKFARGIVALFVFLIIAIVIWSLYQTGKVVDSVAEAKSKTVNAAPTVPAPKKTLGDLANEIKAAPTVTDPEHRLPDLADETEKRKKSELAAEIKSPVSLIVNSIGRSKNEIRANYYLAASFSFKNESDKVIKAFKGQVIIYDVFGERLATLNVENPKDLLIGGSVKESGEWGLFGETKAQNAILSESADTSKLTFKFIPEVVLFKDGSKFEK